MRVLLSVFIGLAAAATIVLYLLPTQTGTLFAWTIASPLTATILGACYAGALTMFLIAIRQRVWANARIAVIAPFTLSTFILIATLLHIDKFHLFAEPIPAFVAWLWLIVYIVVPPTLAPIWFTQQRTPGIDPSKARPLPTALRWLVLTIAVAMAVTGALLFLFPAVIEPGWPWPLTPLTARSIASWLLGAAAGLGHAAWEDDLVRVRPGTAALTVIGLFGLGAIVRYGAEVRWGSPGAIVLVVVLCGFVAIGAVGFYLSLGRSQPAS